MSAFTPPSTGAFATAAGTVLIVDNDIETTRQFAQMLRLAGYQVYTAVNPATGLHQAVARDLDAIILDFRMPLIDGVRFLRELRRSPTGWNVRVAIVTGACRPRVAANHQ
jgi:DNA-binding response OmpR family regulator